jgi:tRNA(Ile)-lysidine synthase
LPYYSFVREKVLQYIRERALLRAGDRVAVAVSGGADSVVLLRILVELRGELGIVLAMAHFNHGLRGEESAADEAFVADLAQEQGLEFHVGHGNVRDHALTSKLSIEAAGRELRYRWLTSLAREQRLDAIATAHTLDDQAETVLLKVLRGAGTKGLAGIYPVRDIGDSSNSGSRVIRPMLSVTRRQVEEYLTALGQTWREDESNLDRRFLRNRVRHELLPLLEREFNPNVRQVLRDLAEVSRGEEEYWSEQVACELSQRTGPLSDSSHRGGERGASDDHNPDRALMLEGFSRLPVALQRRLIKGFAECQGLTLDFEHVESLRGCALGAHSRAELPGGRIAVNQGAVLALSMPERRSQSAYRYSFPIPGEVYVPDLGMTLRAILVSAEFAQEAEPGELLSADLIGPELVLRNWWPGDRFWPAHSRSGKKLKRLFAEEKIPAGDRPSWPVVLSGEEIVWVRGFPVASEYEWGRKGDAVLIDEVAG